MIQFVPIPLSWQAMNLCPGNGFGLDHVIAGKIQRRLRRVLERWEGTPYDTKFAQPGKGAHCSAFICRVLDEMYRWAPIDFPAIPNDIGFHSRSGAVIGLRWFMRRYAACFRLTSGMTQPGDVLLVGPRSGGPGHAMLVGPRENTLWHVGSAGVCYTGYMLPENQKVYAAFRFKDREIWH